MLTNGMDLAICALSDSTVCWSQIFVKLLLVYALLDTAWIYIQPAALPSCRKAILVCATFPLIALKGHLFNRLEALIHLSALCRNSAMCVTAGPSLNNHCVVSCAHLPP